MTKNSRVRFDILMWKPARALLMLPAFPVVLQALALVAVILMVVNGLGVGPGMRADELLTLRKTNITTLAVWGLWWPGMIVAALIFGRAWCTVCPMEMINRAGDTIAHKIG